MHDQTSFFKAIPHILKNLLTDVMLLQQMPEFQQCCRIRDLFIDEVDSKKTSHGIAVIDGFFYSFIGKIEPVLHEVHAEHDFNIFWPAATPVAVIVRSDELDPLIPWNDFIHGIKEFFAFCFSPTIGVFNVTK